MSEHTKGPWKASLTFVENGEEFWSIIGTPNGQEDHLPHKGAFIGKITGVKNRQAANASLIARQRAWKEECAKALENVRVTLKGE